ncbi:MAG: site-specific integrase [Legionellales bacterium]|nr:site-specific integrase [Legionellales bacterium]
MKCPAPLFDGINYLERTPKPINEQNLKKDYEFAHAFIYSYRGSDATFNAYRREIERLLHWSWLIAGKSLSELNRVDMENYIEFCQKPPQDWIGNKQVNRFVDVAGERVVNPAWRPFVVTQSKAAHRKGEKLDPKHYQLSQKALQAIFAVCSSFFNYLIQEGYTEKNPILQIRQKNKFIRKQQTTQVIRRLSELQWAYVIETAEQLAIAVPERHERTLFMINALYGMYLRISELAASPRWEPQMGHFKQDADGNWWFTTVGKGNKERMISVSDAMLKALSRYRRFLGLSNFPALGETTPLLSNTRSGRALGGVRFLRSEVQFCFDETIERLKKDGFQDDAEQLMAATVHWLRHTGISDDVKHRPREHVRDDAGHGSGAITDKYIDVELRARHRSAKNKAIKPEWLDDLIPEKSEN